MDLLAPVKRFDELQRRTPALGIPYAVIKKFGDDEGGHLAALIAYYGFFSLFPLLMAMVSVLGFVFAGDPDAQRAILDSALKQIPIVGEQIKAGTLDGNPLALTIGLVGALLSGLGVTLALQTAFARVYAVPRVDRPNFVQSRLRGLLLLVGLGSLQVASTGLSGAASAGLGGPLAIVGGLVVSLLVNLLLFGIAFRVLTDDAIPTEQLRPGVLMATVLWTALQAIGGAYIHHVVNGAGNAYGTFATVIGLLTWLFLGARVVVYAAELNSVLAQELHPRGMFEPLTEADRRTLRTLAVSEERVPDQQIDVTFADEPGAPMPERPWRSA